MRILIGQPVHEVGITQLENELSNSPSVDCVLFPEGYLANSELVHDACIDSDGKPIFVLKNEVRSIILDTDL